MRFNFIHKVSLLYIAILIDIVMNNILDPPFGGFIGALMTFFVQAAVVMFKLVILLFLFKSTYLFQSDIGELIREFRATMVLTPLNFILLVIIRLYRVFSMLQFYPVHIVWTRPGFMPLYIVQKIVAVLYYLSLYNTAQRLANPKYYRKILTPGTSSNNVVGFSSSPPA